MTILDDILAAKRREVEAAKIRLPLKELEKRVPVPRSSRGFRRALEDASAKPALIAELKRKSPSKGMLRERFDPVSLAQQLQDAGAAALSVLTDERFFGGTLDFLRDVQQFTEIPILRKDFILDAYQLYEAAYYQADAVLLIVQVLSDAQLRDSLQLATQLGLDALVEVHSEEELTKALAADARLIGINHRNLHTFTMHPETTARLIPKIPAGIVIVAESGIQRPEEVQRLKTLGVHAVLIGESLMRAPDPAAKVRELFAGVW
ncbi:MAG: indole-3-glycerol phosphate synthase TrpC [Candidatus Omnitrophica bacterium]|nr:indole-3-glycerol phosphate synthase TrpC [Candidatus Omnitrophota bacterium]